MYSRKLRTEKYNECVHISLRVENIGTYNIIYRNSNDQVW